MFKDDSITFKFYNLVTKLCLLSLAIALVEDPLCILAEASLWVALFYEHWDNAEEPKDSQGDRLSILVFGPSLGIGFHLKDSRQDDLSMLDGPHGSLHYFTIISKGMSLQENKGRASNICLHAHTNLIQIDLVRVSSKDEALVNQNMHYPQAWILQEMLWLLSSA